jgi:hypothetical protein
LDSHRMIANRRGISSIEKSAGEDRLQLSHREEPPLEKRYGGYHSTSMLH